MSLNRSGPRSTHVRVKVVAMNLAHRIPAKRWRLGRRRRRRRERIGSQDRDGVEGGVGSTPGGDAPMAVPTRMFGTAGRDDQGAGVPGGGEAVRILGGAPVGEDGACA